MRPRAIDADEPANGRPVIEDPDLLPDWTFSPVAVVHSPYKAHFDTPRQPRPGEHDDAWIIVRRGLQNALRDLQGFDYAWIVFVFNYSRGGRSVVTPPRDGTPRGVFATRSPHRPNPIGMSCVRVLNVVGRKMLIRDHDLLHGTHVLDIKPYLPYCDAHPEAAAGYVDALRDEAPEHRWI
ncbi:MAG: tRNA (N6-threonylcarbamoyladenosine(37)-N6)-methyltransferase TrmO [Planctomycetota bacterium]